MKQTSILIFAVLLLIFAGAASANCAKIDQINDLTPEIKQELKVKCEQEKLALTRKAEKVPEALKDVAEGLDAETISEWGMVAQEFAKALGIAAKEMGIAVNDFLKTPAGIMTAVVIVWSVMGSSILGILIGIPMMIAMTYAARWLWKSVQIKEITYKSHKTWYGGTKQVIDKIEYEEPSDEKNWGVFAVGCAWVIVNLLIFWFIIP